jgi:hypothetical protein
MSPHLEHAQNGKKKKDILGTYSTLRAFMGRTSEVLTLSKKARESMSVILLRSSLHHAQFLMCAWEWTPQLICDLNRNHLPIVCISTWLSGFLCIIEFVAISLKIWRSWISLLVFLSILLGGKLLTVGITMLGNSLTSQELFLINIRVCGLVLSQSTWNSN